MRNIATKVTRLKAGDRVPANVEGGWVQKEISQEGYLVEAMQEDKIVLFIPVAMIDAADEEAGITMVQLEPTADAEVKEGVPEEVECAKCGNKIPGHTAKAHQGRFYGECCWDERLRTTE